jgi:hypothetical protein
MHVPFSLTDVVIEAHQRAAEFLVALHDDPYFGADAFVDEFCARGPVSVLTFLLNNVPLNIYRAVEAKSS